MPAVPYPHLDGTQLCAQTDPELFFPQQGSNAADAKKMCLRCPLLQPCRDYALQYDVQGHWGGMSRSDRKKWQADHGITPIPVTFALYGLTTGAAS
jgi:hypothetical protein